MTDVLSSLVRQVKAGRLVSENILVDLGGAYLYICWTKDGTRFADGDVSRIGVVLLNPTAKRGGVHFELSGYRLGHSIDGKTYEPLAPPGIWDFPGELRVKGKVVEIEYRRPDETVFETVRPDGEDGDWKGDFKIMTPTGPNGVLEPSVNGEVRHVLWQNSEEVRKQFPTISFDLWEALKPEQVTSWGERIMKVLPASELPTKEEPYFFLDIISGISARANADEWMEEFLAFKAANPGSVIYLVQPQERTISLGSNFFIEKAG